MQPIARLQSQASNVLDEQGQNLTFNKNLELKLDGETGQYYLEKKWNVEKDTQIGNCMKLIYNSWLFSPTTFFIWEIGIVVLFTFVFNISLSGSVRTALARILWHLLVSSVYYFPLFLQMVEKIKKINVCFKRYVEILKEWLCG